MSAASVKHVLDTRVGNRDFQWRKYQYLLQNATVHIYYCWIFKCRPSYIPQIIPILHVNVEVNIGLLFQN